MNHYDLDFTKRDLQNWLKGEVEFLRDNETYSGSYYRLHNSSINEELDLTAVVCWEPGFGEEHRDDCIQSQEEPDWALCVSVREYNPSDTCDAWNLPVDGDTDDILCDSVSLEESDITDKFSHIADFLIRSYEDCLAYDEEHNKEDLEESLIDYSYARKLARKNNLDVSKLEVIIDKLNDGAIDDPSYVRKVIDSKNYKEIENLILSHYE